MNGWATNDWDRSGDIAQEPARPRVSWTERLGEAAVFFVVMTSFYQSSKAGEGKPVPFDILMIVCMGIFFLLGLKLPRGIVWPAAAWGLLLVGYGIGGMTAFYTDKVDSFFLISAYLVCAMIFIAAYVYESPERRIKVVFNAYTTAATIAAAIGVAAYFGFLPSEINLFGRATATFNDPNVFAAFLVAPILYLGLRLSTARSPAALLVLPVLLLLVLGLLLSFSRGAWGSLALAGLIFIGLMLATSRSALQSFRLILFSAFMALAVVGVVIVAISTPKVGALFEQRASIVQDYDVGEQGRFSNQFEAFKMALEKPLGIGQGQWAAISKLDTHNIYINILISGGFLSLFAFLAFLAMTYLRGLRAIFAYGPAQPYLIVAGACIVSTMAEAFIIDVNNWRHLYLLFGMAWGAILACENAKKGAGAEEGQAYPHSHPGNVRPYDVARGHHGFPG